MRMPDLIAKKRDGGTHSPEEIAFVVRGASEGSVPDYQLSAWLMASFLNGLSRKEAVALTRFMADSGKRLRLSGVRARKVDKHSTGGVGDGISLALAPMAAAAGVAVPMMSGRGLGHTGGTLDKLESAKGFKVGLGIKAAERQVRAMGVCMFGQTGELAPADGKLYALRDATSTVESIPLITASILSKKLAEDLDALVLDIKCGSGAFFKKEADAKGLAESLISTAKGLGLKCVGLLTSMEQPLGLAIGTSLELRQAVEVLHGDFSPSDYVEVLLALGGWMVHLGGKAKSPAEGSRVCERMIREGRAIEKFRKMMKAQGADPRIGDQPDRFLPQAPRSLPLKAPRGGYVTVFDAKTAGRASLALGGGRDRMEDRIDYGAGIRLLRKMGDRVAPGEEIARLYSSDPRKLRAGHDLLASGVKVGPKAPRRIPIIRKVWK